MSINNIFSLENNNSFSSFKISEKLLRNAQQINDLSNVRDKLQFYNDNICSLSNDFYGGEIYEYGNTEYYWRGQGKLLFKALPNDAIFEVYLDVRSGEIKRLRDLISSQSRIIEKLKILFEKRAGQTFFNNEACKVYTNEYITFLRNGAGRIPDNLQEFEIDLSYLPTKEDTQDYNQYLYDFYFKFLDNEFLQPIINTYEYNGFNYKLAVEGFKVQLKNALDFQKSLNNEIRRIELFFPLNDYNNIIYSYYESNRSFQWQCALFNGFVNGLQYDFARTKLEVQQIKDLIHIQQVFKYYKILLEFRKSGSIDSQITWIAVKPQLIASQKPVLSRKLITFKNSNIIEKIHSELKGYFPNKEAELLKALQGEQLSEILLFPNNQNKFVEVFRRLKYNGFLLNTDTETKTWICTTFQFVKKKFPEPQPFNRSSVWDILNKGKGEPTKKERICITEWLQYKSPLQLARETEEEKL